MLQPDGTTKALRDVEGWVYIIYVDKPTADCALLLFVFLALCGSLPSAALRQLDSDAHAFVVARLPQAH